MSRLKGPHPKTMGVKRVVSIAGRKTSVHLEGAFWQSLQEIASRQNLTLSELITAIDSERQHEIGRRPFACSCSISISSKFLSASETDEAVARPCGPAHQRPDDDSDDE
jgi:predicted DNA-binding ribbon-helix-helix protein